MLVYFRVNILIKTFLLARNYIQTKAICKKEKTASYVIVSVILSINKKLNPLYFKVNSLYLKLNQIRLYVREADSNKKSFYIIVMRNTLNVFIAIRVLA